jgi:hypothetical protein
MSTGIPSGTKRPGATATLTATGSRNPSAPLPNRFSGLLNTLLDLTLLTGFWLLFFWPILVTRDHLIPYDLIDQHYMFQGFIHRALQSGESSWWSPNILSGYPMVADPLSALFYPPNRLMHLLAGGSFLPYLYLEWQATLHFLWAALGTYFLARALTGSRLGALMAALVYAFGAFFTTHIPHLSPISALSWLPWILLTFRQAVRQPSLAWTGLAALTFGLMALAGHAMTSLQIGYLLVAITLLLVVRRWPQDRRGAAFTAVVGIAVLALGSSLSMVQLLPSWELSSLTVRADLPFTAAAGSSIMPHWLVTLAFPNFFALNSPEIYWAAGDPAESNLYAGLLPLFLTALGVVQARPEDRRITWLLLAGALLALVLAFGSQTRLYQNAFDLLPGFDRVRRPMNYVALMQLAIALLAAFGMQALERRGQPDRISTYDTLLSWLRRGLAVDLLLLVLAGIALAYAVAGPAQQILVPVTNSIAIAGVIMLASLVVLWGCLHWRVSTRAALALLIIITAIDLDTATMGMADRNTAREPNAYIGPDWAGTPSDQVVPFLQSQQRAHPDRIRIYPEKGGSIWMNGPMVWGLESIWGYSVLWPTYYHELYDAAVADPGTPLFDLLNVRYLLTTDPIEQAYPDINLEEFQLISSGVPHIYENRTTSPRVWVAHQSVYQPENSVLAYMKANAASLADTVVLSEPRPEGSESNAVDGGTAEIVEYENTRVVIQASLPTSGFVVLADIYYPSWEARIDGEPTHLYRADHAFRAVWVPAGEHEIEFRFNSSTLRTGSWLSIGALAAIASLLILGGALRLCRRKASRPWTEVPSDSY